MIDPYELVTDRGAAARAVASTPGLRIWQFNGRFQHDVAIDELSGKLHSIEIIDQYSGSIPELFSPRRRIVPKIKLAVSRTLLLDSNVSRYLRKYLRGSLNQSVKGDVEDLIAWIARNDVSIHPGFSLMETLSGGSNPEFDGPELIKMALLLGGMDGDAFLNNGEIKLGAKGNQYLARTFGTTVLDDAAAIEFKRLPRLTLEVVDPTYATLLKIALIADAVPHAQFSRRIDEFMDFLENTLDAVLAVEVVTAILFFSGHIGKFIPLKSSTSFAQRLRALRSSAWDIFLARMAASFIAQGDESELTLPLIITGDERLKKIVRAQRLVGVISIDKRAPYPVVLTDFEYLETVAPKGWDSSSLQSRLAGRQVRGTWARNVDLKTIIADLEEEAARRFS